jgi:hypothetical protein
VNAADTTEHAAQLARMQAMSGLNATLPAMVLREPFAFHGGTAFYRLPTELQIPAAFPICGCSICTARRAIDPAHIAKYDTMAVGANNDRWAVHYPAP